jgi:predicted DCC family thiol-disulfide oxidoreductase YuxK
MLAMHLLLILVIDFADLSLGMVCLHLFTFDPGWIRARRAGNSEGPETVFYDGECGLCHNTVRMLLAEDREGAAFRFSPLQGEALAQALGDEERSELPDSLIVHTHDGRWLSRSAGTAHMLLALGGLWTLLGGLLIRIPRPLRDTAYDLVAANRKRFFAKPAEACPLLPPRLRERFLP